MKKTKLLLSVFLIVFYVICSFSLSHANNDGPEQLKIKGLYLGMDINDAMETYKKYLGDELKFNKFYTGYGIFYQTGDMVGFFDQDSDKKLKSMSFNRILVDQMFNSNGLPGREFAKKFINAYKIPGMKAVGRNEPPGWEFISPHGYRVKINQDGGLIIEKIATSGNLKFD